MKQFLLGVLLCWIVGFAGAEGPTKLEDLTSEQLTAMIKLAVDVNFHFYNDDSVGDNFSEYVADPTNKIKLGLIQPLLGKEISITRVGKVSPEGQLPVEFSFKYPGDYESDGKIKHDFLLREKQVVRISLGADDFGDPRFVINASSVLKNERNRSIRNEVAISEVQLANLVVYLAKPPVVPEEKGYERIKVGTTFVGTYYKGGNDLKFTVTEITPTAGGWNLKATVDFLYQHKTPGSYSVTGKLDDSTGKLRLEKDKVISMPSGFNMLGWTGSLSRDTLEWKGFALEQITVDFSVVIQ